MFMECYQLESIYVGDGWTTDSVTQSSEMFLGCTHILGCQGTTYDENYIDAARAHLDGGPINPGYFSIKGGPAPNVTYAVFSTDLTTLTFYYDNERSSRPGTSYLLNTTDPNPAWLDVAESITQIEFDTTFVNARPTSTRNWFSRMINLDTIAGISNLNTSFVTDKRTMFWG